MPNASDRPSFTRLKTRQLALLVHLDERASVLHAATASHMSQSAASKMLQEIEKALGVELFVRHARGIRPTAYGEIVVRHARASLRELQHAFDEVSALKSGLSGQAAIGTEATSSTTLVPRAVALFKERHPHVLVSIEMDFSEALIERLQDGKLDMVIARVHNAQDLAGLHYHPLPEADHAIVARAGHPLAHKRRVEWKDLVGPTWVLPPQGNVLRSALTALLMEKGVEFSKRVVETASLPVIISLLQLSDMLAPLPTEVVMPYCSAGALKVLPIRLNLRIGAAGIITRADHDLSPGARAMLNTLQRAAAR